MQQTHPLPGYLKVLHLLLLLTGQQLEQPASHRELLHRLGQMLQCAEQEVVAG